MLINVLVVDDESIEREFLKTFLENNHLPLKLVGIAKNGPEALALAKLHKPELILMDIKLPGLSGLEVTEQIKKIHPNTKVIVITAYDEFDFAQKAVHLGVSRYILKPCLPDNLTTVLEAAIQEIKLEKHREEKEESARLQLQEVMPYIQMSLAYDLLSGAYADEDHLKSRLEFVGGSKLPSAVMVADIDSFTQTMNEKSEVEKQFLKNLVFQTIKDTLRDTNAFALPRSMDEIVIFLNGDTEAKHKAFELAEKVRSSVERDTAVTVTIGIGRFNKPSQLYRSYEEACEAQQLGKFFLGSNRVIHIDDFLTGKDKQFEYPFKLEKILVEKIKSGERDAAKSVGSEIVGQLLQQSSLDYVKFYLNELLTVLSRNVVACDYFERVTELNLKYLGSLISCKEGHHLYRWLNNVIDDYISFLYKQHCSQTTQAIFKAVQFIETNFRSEISLSDVSDFIYLNPQYFSRMFKEKMGVSFVEYLTQVRVNRAKELLSFTDYSINYIAEDVGIKDANYFSRVFKKSEGTTPSEYRLRIKK